MRWMFNIAFELYHSLMWKESPNCWRSSTFFNLGTSTRCRPTKDHNQSEFRLRTHNQLMLGWLRNVSLTHCTARVFLYHLNSRYKVCANNETANSLQPLHWRLIHMITHSVTDLSLHNGCGWVECIWKCRDFGINGLDNLDNQAFDYKHEYVKKEIDQFRWYYVLLTW